jgi:hypothetical protein
MHVVSAGPDFQPVHVIDHEDSGAESHTAALAMTFKLIESAQERRRAVNAPRVAALARAGARFQCGDRAEREEHAA